MNGILLKRTFYVIDAEPAVLAGAVIIANMPCFYVKNRPSG
jgi:hypothetical protein